MSQDDVIGVLKDNRGKWMSKDIAKIIGVSIGCASCSIRKIFDREARVYNMIKRDNPNGLGNQWRID